MEILEQNAAYVVCVKPAGIPSQGEGPEAMPARLAAELRALSAQPAAHPPAHPPAGPSASPAEPSLGLHGEIYPVHRLDQAVGGVMVFARSRVADRLLSGQVQRREFEKEYLAVIEGILPEKTGLLEDWLLRDRRTRKTIAVSQPGPETRPAALKFETLAEENGRSLVRIRLLTGRTHQIRVHMKSIGHPVCGDPIYGSGRGAKVPRLMLHAYTLSFTHPRTGERMTFTAPLPEEFVQGLRGNGVEWEK